MCSGGEVLAYYNEIDPYCCAWLSNLMDAGLITKGKIDDRPIQQLTAEDVRRYDRCHFFAGVAGWELALNIAEWGDRPVWSGSAPCQPFSVTGKGKAQQDERHLWPHWFRLIARVRPSVVFGEQVAGALAHGWWDDAADDLEREGYETGAAVLPACSVGAPHKRDRLWFVAYAESAKCSRFGAEQNWKQDGFTNGGETVADSPSQRLQGQGEYGIGSGEKENRTCLSGCYP
jgi:DNA (cytosine-5)-methyltransferase 1